MTAQAAEPTPPFGLWWTQDKDGVIEMTPCGEGLCARIVGQPAPLLPNGSRPVDVNGANQCQLMIVSQARRDEQGRWRGMITNPEDGSKWQCLIWMEAGILKLRGYELIPLFGQTQSWTAFTGRVTPDCHIL